MKHPWKVAHMKAAHGYAMCSEAERNKVGCVIVKDDAVISVGINGTPQGFHTNSCEILVDGELLTRPEVIHAEANALDKITRSHSSSDGASMFVTLSPCLPCAIRIRNSRIKELYFGEPYRLSDGIDYLMAHGITCTHLPVT